MIYADIRHLAYETRSIRAYDESFEVTKEMLEYLVDTARFCPSAGNMQPIKYKLCLGEDAEKVKPLTKWAGLLKPGTVPPEGKWPVAFIVICHDKTVCQKSDYTMMDVGIAAQTICLAAREKELGTCMIGSFDQEKLADELMLPRSCDPMLVVAIGKPDQSPILCSPFEEGDVKYYMNDAGLHFVPKRPLKEVILK